MADMDQPAILPAVTDLVTAVEGGEAAEIEIETETEADEVGGWPVAVPVFSGPLDLLLHLIRKNKVSVYDIPISSICDQYHEYLNEMPELDLEVAGEFLWMASWLLHLKSKMLLPSAAKGEEDPREELVERLLEYRRVKELAAILHEEDIVRRLMWEPQLATDLGAEETELDWQDVDLRLLAHTYLEVMQRFAAAHPPPLQVLPLRFTVQQKMLELYTKVIDDKLVALLRHLHTRSDPEEVVTLVVATLELVRLGGVCAEQGRPFAEIYLRPGSKTIDVETLHSRDESTRDDTQQARENAA